MSSTKPIKLYSHAQGPNPWKVAIILEELGVPYESDFLDFSTLKQEPYISVNPNGRVPAIEDPNTGIVLWETGAIIDYVLETYDKDNSLQYTTSPEKWNQRAWASFQTSGQGPYFGQLTWFKYVGRLGDKLRAERTADLHAFHFQFHPEKNLTSAIDRYTTEIKRVLGVIDAHLKKHNQPYLVGEEACYADLMFITWNNVLKGVMQPEFEAEWKETMPHAWEWHQKLLAREGVKKAMAVKEEAVKNAGGH